MTKLADSAGPSLLLYISNREPHLFGVSARMYALYLYNLVVHFITKATYYLAHASGQEDFMYHPSLLPLDKMSFTPSHLFIYFFSIYFLSAEACQSISGSMKLCYAKSHWTLHIIYSRSSIQKRRSSCGISPFPSSFDASGFVRRAGALRNVCIFYLRSSRAFFVWMQISLPTKDC